MSINPWKSDKIDWQHSSGSEDISGTGKSNTSGQSYAHQFAAAGSTNTDNSQSGENSSDRDKEGSSSYRDKFLSPARGMDKSAHKDKESFDEPADESAGGIDKEDTGAKGQNTGDNSKKGKSRKLLRKLEERRRKLAEEDLPSLTKNARKQLNRNFRELSLVEGNLRGLDRELTTVYCTSCFEREGKTTAAASVAFGLVEFGDCQVLLIDSNYESPQIHRLFGISRDPGLQELICNSVKAEEAIIPTACNGLYILTAGEGQKPLATEETGELLKEFKDNFDFVVIDGKTLFSSSEVTNLAQAVDGYIVVVECEQTKWEVVQLAQEKLIKAGAQHAGILLNKRRYYLPGFIYRLISRS